MPRRFKSCSFRHKKFGEVPERLNGYAWRAYDRKIPGFESLPLRYIFYANWKYANTNPPKTSYLLVKSSSYIVRKAKPFQDMTISEKWLFLLSGGVLVVFFCGGRLVRRMTPATRLLRDRLVGKYLHFSNNPEGAEFHGHARG